MCCKYIFVKTLTAEPSKVGRKYIPETNYLIQETDLH